MKQLGLTLALLTLFAQPVLGQTQGGSVTGFVRDQQGAAVPGSAVSLRGPDATFQFFSGRDGSYHFLNLEPGTYTLTATLDGFRPAERRVVVAVGKSVEASLELYVAGVVDSVTVSAPAPVLDRKATGTSTTFTRD